MIEVALTFGSAVIGALAKCVRCKCTAAKSGNNIEDSEDDSYDIFERKLERKRERKRNRRRRRRRTITISDEIDDD